MKVLVTGACGQLGYDVLNELGYRNFLIVATDVFDEKDVKFYDKQSFACKAPYIKLDITDKDAVSSVINSVKPDAVIHCSAWTNVDGAEDEENRELVYKINHKGTENIATSCKAVGAKMLYVSTDYVFSGNGNTPWKPDEKDYNPLNVYGDSKLQGERAVCSTLEKFFIVRTAWVFGINGNNFINTMLSIGKKFDTLTVVNDQIGTPTYTFDLARLLVDMILTEKYGYYHATNEGGFISWYDFAVEIFKCAGYATKVLPVSTLEYKASKAKRPFNSRLDKSKLKENGFIPLPNYKDALKHYLNIKLKG